MRQDILKTLHKLLSGTIDTIKVTCRTSKMQEIMKFEMFGYAIEEKDGIIRIIDSSDNKFFSPKMVFINPLAVENVTYENDRESGSEIHCRKVILSLEDKSRIELETVAFG